MLPKTETGPQRRHARSCDVVVVTCCDWRIWEEELRIHLAHWQAEKLRYDLLAVPGAIHRLVHGPEHRTRTLLEDLDAVVAQDMPETLLLAPHMHCATYQEQFLFPDEDQERSQLAEDIGIVWDLLTRRYPRVAIRGYVVEIDPRAGRMVGLTHTRFSVPPVPPSMPPRP